jgi:hypothetical protein
VISSTYLTQFLWENKHISCCLCCPNHNCKLVSTFLPRSLFFVQLQFLDLFQFQPEALEETCLVQTYRRTNSALHIYANGENENIFSTSVRCVRKKQRSLMSFIYRCNTRTINSVQILLLRFDTCLF